MSNHLAHEKSPYLLQHADNPVDWFPWSQEALARAQADDKPILVSIGYSACHWCHVMAHESFEDADTADLMNQHFVNIKVDREERPDVDGIYMEAVQALTGHGGWPLNVFLTPDGKPFYGGTYFPPEPRHGLPSWRQVLLGVAEAYKERRADIVRTAASLTQALHEAQHLPATSGEPTPELLTTAYAAAAAEFDRGQGGFGSAPKFPQPMSLEFVLRMYLRTGDESARDYVVMTLRRMAYGGLYDQLGGGFHRYSVDGYWLVPHFEKMLYDNALLARVYLHAYQLVGDAELRRITEETLDYLLRDMRAPEGAFYSAQDADSEGVEGKYYLWTSDDLERLFGPDDAQPVALQYGVTREGNFEGKTILTLAKEAEAVATATGRSLEATTSLLHRARKMMLDDRYRRVAPATDTKILVSWNALAIQALAEAGRALGRPDYVAASGVAAGFLLDHLRPEGRLRRSYRDGPSAIDAFLEDYSYLIDALITLYETTGDVAWFREARALTIEMVRRFWDDSEGGFYDTAGDAQPLVVRPRSFYDNPVPSGNSAATYSLVRLEALTGDSAYASWALAAFRATQHVISRAPLAFAHLLCALDFYLGPPVQVAIAVDGGDADPLADVVFHDFLPHKVVAIGTGTDVPLLAGREAIGGKPTAYVCRHFSCRLPVTEADQLKQQLDEIRSSLRLGTNPTGSANHGVS